MKFKSFKEMLLSNVKSHANNVALAYDEDGEIKSLTYAELYREISARREQIARLDANCVGILQAPSKKWIIDMFACVLARKQTVLLDPMSEPTVIQAQTLATDVETLLTDELTSRHASLLKTAPVGTVAPSKDEGDILFFTSGTTNSSKAVVLTSSSLCASAWNGQAKCPCNETDNLLCMLPLTHVFGFVCAMLWPMSQGAKISITRGMRYIAQDCKYFKPTIISVVPSILKFLVGLNALNDELRMVLVGAGPANEQTLAAAKEKGIEVRFGYGLTETSSGVAISCGENPFAMSVCPDDTITLADDGEVLVKADECMMKGYYKNEKDTEKVLEPDGWLHTGDMGTMDPDGTLYIRGRSKTMILSGSGQNIYPEEIEDKLNNMYLVLESLVLEHNGKLHALVVPDYEQAEREGVDKNDLPQIMENNLKELNTVVAGYEHVAAITIYPTEFEKTPKRSIKRYLYNVTLLGK